MRWIFISPHFDDAVLSCGGLICELNRQGIKVEIWTVNSGIPPVGPISDLITRVHAKWNTGSPEETVILRREEDQNAALQVGAVLQHLGMVDAIYRRSVSGEYFYTEDVFDPIHPGEADIVQQTAACIAASGLEDEDIIVCPLALGGHVDHVIVRMAVEILGRETWYYADIPYLFMHEEELVPAVEGMREQHFSISDESLGTWQVGIEAYTSQLSSLFVDIEDMHNRIKNYRDVTGGVRIWTSALHE
jgi:LmbE family N-acetylglucosaminyl deacetylase